MKTIIACLCVAFLLSCATLAQASAVREVAYSPDAALPVRTALGVTTVIELDPSEEVLDYSVGFAQGWDVTRRDQVFYVKPRDVDVGTNMLIRTRTRQYMLELQVAAGDWNSLSEVASAGVAYRVAIKIPAPPAEAVPASPSVALNYGYELRADRTLSLLQLPILAFDDGVQTTLRFRDVASRQQAIVFGKAHMDDAPFLVNRTVRGNDLVVDGVFPLLELRVGNARIEVRKGGH